MLGQKLWNYYKFMSKKIYYFRKIKILAFIISKFFPNKLVNKFNNRIKEENIDDVYHKQLFIFKYLLIKNEYYYLLFGLIFYYKKKYLLSLIYLSNFRKKYENNDLINSTIIEIMFELETYPSKALKIYNYYGKHDDIYLSNWSIGNAVLKWVKILKLEENFIYTKNNEVNIYANYPSFISMHLFLAIISIKNGFKVNFFYSSDFYSIEETDKYINYIVDSEILTIKEKNFSFINFFKINTNRINNKKNLPEDLYNKITELTFLDVNYFTKKYFNFKINDKINFNIKEKKIFQIRKRRNLNIAKYIYEYLKISKNYKWIIHNGTNVETGSIVKILNYFNTDYISFEYSLVRKKFFYSKNEIVTKRLVKSSWNTFNKLPIKTDELKRTKLIIKNLKNKFIKNPTSNMKYLERLNHNLRTFIIYANHPVETRYYDHENHIFFESIFSWIKETINFLKEYKCNIIVKLHPSELLDKSILNRNKLDVLISKEFKKLNNLIIINDANFDTYALFKIYNSCNIIYDSDIGLELILNNQNFISCGYTMYKHLKIGINPKNKQKYFYEIEKNLKSRIESINLTEKKLAFKFVVFWYHYIMHDFPCFIGNSTNEINNIGIKNIFADNGYFKLFQNLFNNKNTKGWGL